MKKTIFGIFGILSALPAFALELSGTVLDDYGPVAGVAIRVDGASHFIAETDENGKFKIFDSTGVKSTDKLSFEMFGLETLVLPATQAQGTITMKLEAQQLDDVLVTECIINESRKIMGIKAMTLIDGQCYPTECLSDWTLEGNGKRAKCKPKTCECGKTWDSTAGGCRPWTSAEKKCTDNSKIKKPQNAAGAELRCDAQNKPYCHVLGCITGYEASDDGKKCVKVHGTPCTAADFEKDHPRDSNAKSYRWELFIGRPKTCLIDTCNKNYEPNDAGTKCEQVSGTCESSDEHADKTKLETRNGKTVCIIKSCVDGYMPSDDELSCIVSEGPCTDEQLKSIPHATAGEMKKGKCQATKCDDGFEPSRGQCVTTKECTAADFVKNNTRDTNAKSYRWADTANGRVCLINKCAKNYEPNDAGTKCEQVSGTCESSDEHADKTKLETRNGKTVCIIKSCVDGYMPSDDELSCIVSEGPCTDEQLAKIENATAGEMNKGICYATECADGFEVANGKCVAIGGNCNPMPENAQSAHREYDAETKTEICIIDSCKKDYSVSEDGLSCVYYLSEAESQAKIDELRDNAQAMKEKEQSLANRTLGAAAIGATGIGGMMAMSALSEQQSDADAERDMAAYLQTFRCDFGTGKRIDGGAQNVELPGANELMPLYSEYIALANNLKLRKQALGMRAGIESETILDQATTGLYDDIGTGKTSGMYVSLAAALSGDADALAAWDAQKAKTAENLKTGLTTAGIGAAVGLVGNAIINSKSAKNKADEIVNKYKKTLKDQVEKIPAETKQCPENASEQHPNCTCTGNNEYNPNTNTCDPCPANQVANNGKCACPSDKPLWDSENKTCIPKSTKCTAQCTPTDGDNLVIKNDCSCDCLNGFTFNVTAKTCECPSPKTIDENGVCTTPKQPQQIIEKYVQYTRETNSELSSEHLFKIGSYELQPQAQTALKEFMANLAKDFESCKIQVKGYTDPVGSETTNKKLSENRARAVSQFLDANKGTFNAQITATGYGETNCHCGIGSTDGKQNDSDYKYCVGKDQSSPVTGNERYAPCRRIEIDADCIMIEKTTEQQ